MAKTTAHIFRDVNGVFFVAHLQVFLGHLTHQSSLHTTPCLPGLLVPSHTPWAGSCNSKLDFFFF